MLSGQKITESFLVNKSVFITVRTNSSRLKNKALLEIKGKSTIEHLIDRMLRGYSDGMIPGIDNIVLCARCCSNIS